MARQEKWEILLPDRQTIQKILLLWQHQISSLPTSKIVFWHLYFFRGEDNTEKSSKCLRFSFPWITSQTPCKRVHDRWLGFLWRTLLVIFVHSFLSPLKNGLYIKTSISNAAFGGMFNFLRSHSIQPLFSNPKPSFWSPEFFVVI